MESRNKVPAWRSPCQFSRLVGAGLSALAIVCGCDFHSRPNKTEVYRPAMDGEPLIQHNLVEEKRDGFVLRSWTDGKNFFTSGAIDVYFELECPDGFVPRRVRISIDSPGISHKHSSCSRDFRDPTPKLGNTYRFVAADCFLTSTKLDVPNGLNVGSHLMTGKVVVDDGPTFDVKYEVKVVLRSSD